MQNSKSYIPFIAILILLSCSNKEPKESSLKRFEHIVFLLNGKGCKLNGYSLEWRGGVSVLTYYKNERIKNCYHYRKELDSLKVDNFVSSDSIFMRQKVMDCICYYSNILNKYQVESIEFSADSITWKFVDTVFYTTSTGARCVAKP